MLRKQSTSVLRLKDGRQVEYAEFGDPHGRPVFYFHGFLGSLHQAKIADEAAKRESIRIISPNRPGIGKSSPRKRAPMTAYAADIAELADHLKLDTFAIIGTSGGGCFALAVTYMLPRRVRLASVAGGIGPLDNPDNMRPMGWFRQYFLSGCNGYPLMALIVLKSLFLFCRYYPTPLHKWLVGTSSLLDTKELNPEDVKRVMWWDYQDVFLGRTGMRGLILESYQYFHWGFDLRNFPRTNRVLFWHGKDDPIIPWSDFKKVVRGVARKEIILFPGGHMAFLTQVARVLGKVNKEYGMV